MTPVNPFYGNGQGGEAFQVESVKCCLKLLLAEWKGVAALLERKRKLFFGTARLELPVEAPEGLSSVHKAWNSRADC